MIETFNISNRREANELLLFINETDSPDFYFTKDNTRTYIVNLASLKLLVKDSIHVLTLKEKGNYVGVIALWKGFGGGQNRYYVKMSALNDRVAENLLTALLWITGKDLYWKIRNDSSLVQVAKKKGFRFKAGRGLQILLNRKARYNPRNFKQYKEEEE